MKQQGLGTVRSRIRVKAPADLVAKKFFPDGTMEVILECDLDKLVDDLTTVWMDANRHEDTLESYLCDGVSDMTELWQERIKELRIVKSDADEFLKAIGAGDYKYIEDMIRFLVANGMA